MKAKVIIAPLNWGLGHATRSIPLIRSFLEKDWEVILASDGEALKLLQAEFPSLRSFEMPGYDITYPYRNIIGNLFRNLRSFSNGAIKEFQVIQEIVEKEKPDLILSDNRYGVRSSTCKSIFMGHQLNLKAGNHFLSYFASRVNQRLISQFDELWVPDYENGMALAGILSKTKLAIPVQYIGPLSRFEKLDEAIEYDLCAIISGPEPQRSRFQKILIEQLSVLDENTVIVLGDVNDHSDEMLNDTTRVIGHLTSEALNLLVNQSKVIIARSGYSTIMDMHKLGKQAILVPTPGQTEQIYLAHFLANQPEYLVQSQKKINIPHALEKLLKKKKVIQHKSKFDIDDFLVLG